jgi:succinoglycan biosynthesis transport protein ExoP
MEQFQQSDFAETTVDLKEYFYLFWSWAWLIALAGILAGAAAYVVSINTLPIFETSTRLLVSAPPATTSSIDTSGMVNTQTMTSTYSQMLLDRPVLQGVIDQLKLSITPDELKKTISVDVVINTQLLVITVDNPDPMQAANIANAMDSVFAARIRELQSERYAASRDGLAKQVSDMEGQITDTNNQIAATKDTATLEQLQARLTQYRTLYSNLVTSYEQIRLAEEQTSTNVVVSEPASVPYIPVSPKTTRNTLLAVVAGMLLAGGAVFAGDTLDDTIKDPEELRRRFNLPILGMIASHQTKDNKPITQVEPRSPTSEAFRALRTNITFAAVDRPLRRIMITSPTPKDGKTTISSSLAVVLAQAEKQVVLIDADLRRPQIHRKFGIHNRIGLADLFVRPLDALAGMVKSVDIPGLAVITSGGLPPNPAELLTSQKMIEILDRLNQDFDVILIDTPPVLTVTDAAALASAMDGVILVAKPGSTKLSAFQQTVVQLRAVGARLLGVVLNEVNPVSRKYGYYYNRYYSKYSYQYQQTGAGPAKIKQPDKIFQPEMDKSLQADVGILYPAEPDRILPQLKIKNK